MIPERPPTILDKPQRPKRQKKTWHNDRSSRLAPTAAPLEPEFGTKLRRILQWGTSTTTQLNQSRGRNWGESQVRERARDASGGQRCRNWRRRRQQREGHRERERPGLTVSESSPPPCWMDEASLTYRWINTYIHPPLLSQRPRSVAIIPPPLSFLFSFPWIVINKHINTTTTTTHLLHIHIHSCTWTFKCKNSLPRLFLISFILNTSSRSILIEPMLLSRKLVEVTDAAHAQRMVMVVGNPVALRHDCTLCCNVRDAQ